MVRKCDELWTSFYQRKLFYLTPCKARRSASSFQAWEQNMPHLPPRLGRKIDQQFMIPYYVAYLIFEPGEQICCLCVELLVGPASLLTRTNLIFEPGEQICCLCVELLVGPASLLTRTNTILPHYSQCIPYL